MVRPPVRTGTLLHRAEHALLALALAGVLVWLVAWQDATTWGRVAFWAIAPDLVFVPMLLGMRADARAVHLEADRARGFDPRWAR